MVVTITNPSRRKKWGWGYSTTPASRNGVAIKPPSSPDYVGTIGQVQDAIRRDRGFQAMRSGGTYTNSAWFWDGLRISGVWDASQRTWVSMHDALRWWDLTGMPNKIVIQIAQEEES